MKILVVCGAGASSTFVAQRLRTAAHNAGMALEVVPVPRSGLENRLQDAEVVLIGPHLPDAATVQALAETAGVRTALIPADAYADPAGTRLLVLLDSHPQEGTS